MMIGQLSWEKIDLISLLHIWRLWYNKYAENVRVNSYVENTSYVTKANCEDGQIVSRLKTCYSLIETAILC